MIATIVLCSALVGASAESLDMLGSVLPLQIAAGHAVGAFSGAQKDAMSYLALQLQDTGLLISFLFWGLDELLTGYLIFQCRQMAALARAAGSDPTGMSVPILLLAIAG